MAGASDLDILKAACCVAGLDEEIDPGEREILHALARRAGVGDVSLDAMMEQARVHPERFEEQIHLLRVDVDETIKTLARVAIVDGRLATAERVVLAYVADKIGMATDRFDQIMRAAERRLGE